MSYHDTNRKLQDAISEYLKTNLATYAGGIAANLPVLSGGDFDDLGRPHVLVFVPQASESPAFSGNYECDVVVRVATLRDTTEYAHRASVRAAFDLLHDRNLAAYLSAINGNNIRVNQIMERRSISIGNVTDAMRHDTMSMMMMTYISPVTTWTFGADVLPTGVVISDAGGVCNISYNGTILETFDSPEADETGFSIEISYEPDAIYATVKCCGVTFDKSKFDEGLGGDRLTWSIVEGLLQLKLDGNVIRSWTVA